MMRAAPRRRNQPEKIFQSNLVQWGWLVHKITLIHIPNELMRFLSDGERIWYRKLGCRPGLSDMFLMEPRGQYHGLIMELKDKGKKPTEEQLFWLDYLAQRGYYACWCDTFEKATTEIENYLKLPKQKELTMNSLELALLQPIFNYLLDLLEKKYGARIVDLEAKIEQLLTNHESKNGN